MARAALVLVLALGAIAPAAALEPIPDKLVVLTFDGVSKSHFTVARPALKKYGFGATFFVTDGSGSATDRTDSLTWDEIARLHQDGFEIGNHARDPVGVDPMTVRDLPARMRAIERRCREHGIPTPISFAYPGDVIVREALPVLKDLGIRFARRGGVPEYPGQNGSGFAYEPGLDHPLLVPTAGDIRPTWTLDDFKAAAAQAKHGKIVVLRFHTITEERFESFLKHLADNGFIGIAVRDLTRYVDPTITPSDPFGVIADRKRLLEARRDGGNARPAADDAGLRYWLENTLVHHGFTPAEAGAALGLTADEAVAAAKRLGIDPSRRPARADGDPLRVLPYPGGRHPRVGFLDGAIRPQRETKVSVFAPWAGGGYAVADVPEAIWFEPGGKRELLYLAHTHVPTVWDKRGVALDRLEWVRHADGSLTARRELPDTATFAAKVMPGADGVRMELSVTNRSDRPLTGLRVQMCVMLKGLAGFDGRTNDNKVFAAPFAACRDESGRRWVVTGWERCIRAWGNPPCPCLHADPQLPDCPPGQTRTVRGWLSFYLGTDINAELSRLRKIAFE